MALLAPTATRPRSTPVPKPGRRTSPISTAGLARLSALHPWRVIACWVVTLALAAFAAQGIGDALTTEVTFTNRPESVVGDELLAARFRPYEPVTETVVIRSETAVVDDAAFRAVVEQTTAALSGMAGVVDSVSNYYQAQEAGDPSASGLVSADRHATILPVTLVGTFEEAAKQADAYLATVAQQRQDGFEVVSVGAVSSDHTFGTMAEEDLQRGEAIGIPVALVVLVIVFAALVAAGLPLILGAVAIVVALGMTAIVGRGLDLFVFVTNVITMLGLAVGIDYSLFVIARYREERRRGFGKLGAIELTGGTASKAVLFSGSTVVLALAGMFFVPLSVFQSIGIAAILVVLAAIAATMTLIPALLSLLGDRIDWPRRGGEAARRRGGKENGNVLFSSPPRRLAASPPSSGFWDRVTRLVMARPVISAGLSVALLGALAVPAFALHRGTATVSSLPASDVKRAFEILATDFSAGRIDPVEIVVDGNRDDPATQAAIERLSDALVGDPAFGETPRVEWNAAGDLALVSTVLAMDANVQAAYDTIDRVRQETIPDAFAAAPDARVYVTGATAQVADYFREVDDVTPWVFTFVLGLSFLLLTVVFRSIVVAAKAIVMNLLSVGAAYGLLVLVFQKGYGADFLGFGRTPAIEAWLPIFLFCILFGLSMDYHVFLLSRIREHYDLTGDNREAVATGLRTTARIITGAALIMVAVFAGFAAGRLVQLQEMGFGLAVAVFLDATVVRSILVPAAMELLGDKNWYLPRWLRWLPDLRIEGEPAAWP
jgi:RND superfamily putative drug exporter